MIILASLVGVLLMSCSFLVFLLLIVMGIIVHMKIWYEKKMEESDRRFVELKERIDDTQALFRNEVIGLIQKFDKILSGIDKKKPL